MIFYQGHPFCSKIYPSACNIFTICLTHHGGNEDAEKADKSKKKKSQQKQPMQTQRELTYNI